LRAFLLPLLLAVSSTAQTQLEMGKMWTFENPPLAYLEKEYDFRPDGKWLDAMRLASLRFGNGCSASFVSSKGLVMTNHHCVRDYIAQVQKEHDWVRDGFTATGYEQEVPIPRLTVQQLIGTADVTARVNEGIQEGDDAGAIDAKRAANSSKLLEAAKLPGHRSQVVKLHQGAAFLLYTYRIFDDVRLVCAPHLQTAHFGGDPDNFTYPRYAIDFAFCRAYEDGKPADTSKHYFKWSKSGPSEGELVFVTGNPGSTGRLLTHAQMEYLRDANYPLLREQIDNRVRILHELSAKDAESEKLLKTPLLGLENAQKAYMGYHAGLLDTKLMAKKAAFEEVFRNKVKADPKLQAKYGRSWDELERISKRKAALEAKVRFYTPGMLPELARALAHVRVAGGNLAAANAITWPAEGSTDDLTGLPFFVDHLTRAAKHLGVADPFVKAALGGRTPAEAAAALRAGSKCNDRLFVEALLKAGKDEIERSADPALRLARVLAPLNDAVSKERAALDAEEGVHAARIGEALFAVYGDKVSPDATFTLRFSDGRVRGFPFNGTIAPWRTTFYGLYARNVEFDDRHPFDMPRAWLQRKDAIEMARAVNFVSTNDIIGGNSGSPVVNQKLEVVGLIFDGNIESLPNRFLFTDEVARSVSVHVDAIVEALRKVYDAGRIADELGT
jgi:hypothetical protein